MAFTLREKAFGRGRVYFRYIHHGRNKAGIFFYRLRKREEAEKYSDEHVWNKVGTVVIDKTQPEKDNALVMNRFVSRRQLMQQGAVHVFKEQFMY